MFTSTFIGTPQINLMEGELIKKGSEWVFNCDELIFHINNKHYQYKNLEQKKVIFGIRPENIFIVDIDNTEQNKYVAEIDFIENLGSEMNVHLLYKSKRFISRINYNERLNSDKTLPVCFDTEKGHFFDYSTEQIL